MMPILIDGLTDMGQCTDTQQGLVLSKPLKNSAGVSTERTHCNRKENFKNCRKGVCSGTTQYTWHNKPGLLPSMNWWSGVQTDR